jgi:hypothetical protein
MDLPLHTHTGSCKKSDVMGPSKYFGTSEAAFRQHILRVAFQVYVWTHANEAKPPPRSPLEYGWRNENKYLMPKYVEDQLPTACLLQHIYQHQN